MFTTAGVARASGDGQIGEIDVDREAREISDEEVDRGAALEREDALLGNGRENADQERDLCAVSISEGHRAFLAR